MVVSLLLPTRKRLDAVRLSLESLVSKMSGDNELELMLGFDMDDDTREAVVDMIRKEFPSVTFIAHVSERHGYRNLHKYYNSLSRYACGDWLFLWNDDTLMETQDWDKVIEENDGQFLLLSPQCREGHWKDYPGTLFPIIPRKWVEVTGRFSNNAHNDTWVGKIAQHLGIFKFVPIYVIHDRADMTGNNDDETYREGKSGYDLERFDQQHGERMEDAAKIKEYLQGA